MILVLTESDITKASPSAQLGIGGLSYMWVLQYQKVKNLLQVCLIFLSSAMTTRLTIFSFLVILFSCNSKEKDKTLKIYHLKPNRIEINTDTLRSYGWYSKTRNDFFAIKNFDATNENHKIKIDSFVVDYISKDSFLEQNDNAKWSLSFFRYGDDINENTKHQYNTDYTIHKLFAQKKEIGVYTFDSQTGYRASFYWINYANLKSDNRKRKILLDYFNIKAAN
jgi:hypothetical protein